MIDPRTIEQEIQSTALALVEKASVARLTNQDDLDTANGFVLRFAEIAKRWKAFWAEPIEKAKASHDGLRERRDAVLKPVEEAKERIRRLISDYLTEQRLVKEAAEKRAFEEEQARIRKEAEAKESLELAEMAELQGEKGLAEEFLAKAAEAEKVARPATAVYVPKSPELQDQTTRMVYDFVVTNVALLPREYMMANETAIRAFVNLTKGAIKIPGVTITPRIITVMKRRTS